MCAAVCSKSMTENLYWTSFFTEQQWLKQHDREKYVNKAHSHLMTWSVHWVKEVECDQYFDGWPSGITERYFTILDVTRWVTNCVVLTDVKSMECRPIAKFEMRFISLSRASELCIWCVVFARWYINLHFATSNSTNQRKKQKKLKCLYKISFQISTISLINLR